MGQFAIGTDDFIKFKEKSAYYIDKSLFIKEIINDTNEVLLITRPRRFGKTLNMSMLNSYLAYSDKNYTHLFSDLKIWDAGVKYREYFQNTPTIFFTMKNVCCDNWNECYSMLVIMISEIFRGKQYLKESLSAKEALFKISIRRKYIKKNKGRSNLSGFGRQRRCCLEFFTVFRLFDIEKVSNE